LGDSRRQGVDVAVAAIKEAICRGEPVVRYLAGAHDIAEHRQHEVGVSGGRQLAVVRDLADLPEPGDVGAGLGLAADVGVAQRRLERDLIGGDRRARQARLLRQRVEGMP
jgi:hypothetical protein